MEIYKPMFLCKNEESHDDDLLPFYHSNSELKEIYNLICDSSEEKDDYQVTYSCCICRVKQRIAR